MVLENVHGVGEGERHCIVTMVQGKSFVVRGVIVLIAPRWGEYQWQSATIN